MLRPLPPQCRLLDDMSIDLSIVLGNFFLSIDEDFVLVNYHWSQATQTHHLFLRQNSKCNKKAD